MVHPRRLRFATELHDPIPGLSWLDSFREIEQLGYSTVFVPDHFDEGPGPIAAVAAAAAVTSTLKVGVLVFDCDFRHPAVLARELATVDVISGGRLEVGLGAGWKKLDYDHSGIAMDRPGVRVSRLIEHTAVLKGLWADGAFSHSGDHYEINELNGTPAPFTPGGPPILVGGGAPRLLRWAGATADIVGVNASIHSGEIDGEAAQDGLAERIDQKVAWLREGAGDRFDDLELNAWIAAAELTEDRDLIDGIAALFGTDAASFRQSPLALVGSPGEVAEMLVERRERWDYSYHVIPGDKAV
ncbi:MAG: TIGR03621 family F420-dependent LLM class oxidoreductase, partial [Aquihabitans sp.]